MDLLNRYYTKDIISSLLINNLKSKSPQKILDLGIGNASLSIAAYSKWTRAKYYATEIEPRKADNIEKNLSFIKVYKYNTLNANTSSLLKIKFGSIDVAICNPPYSTIIKDKSYENLFKSIGCSDFYKLTRLTSEIVFFAHNLNLLKQNGELAIIVSDSLITGKQFEIFRTTVLNNFSVNKIIQLPDKVFDKTEARTHIIFISKCKDNSKYCDLYSSCETGKLSKKLRVLKSDLVTRMDYQYHLFKVNQTDNQITLKDIGANISRGRFMSKDLIGTRLSYFHSTSFKKHASIINFNKSVGKKFENCCGKTGDILMCRVGKRAVGKVALIKKGKVIFSDCIYKISVPVAYRLQVFNSLKSPSGQKWLKAYAHGVCSQVISKTDLMNFPIDYID